MNREVENFLASFRFSASTKASYRRILNLFSDVDFNRLDPSDLLKLIDRPEWGNSQQNVAIFCVQKFLRWRHGSLHPALSAKIPRVKPKPRRSLTEEKALQLLALFNPYKAPGARDLALASFGLDTGFRRGELCSVQLGDVNFDRNVAVALCKGGQYKAGAFSPVTAHILQSWIQFRRPADGVGNLFINLHTGRALTGDGMECIFKRWSKVIGFRISPHDLRSSFATLSTFYGAPSRTVQVAGRWGSIEMVEHYTGNLELDAIKPHLPMSNLKKS